jgi:anthranilate synthase/aminodeoxychorismate synthase-like glutamine amidotransferase
MQKILVVDNYDSFTYNLVQQIKITQQCEVVVKRNDEFQSFDYSRYNEFDKIVISPGPKKPKDAGISKFIIKSLYKQIPILGVCLGMQCINEVFGGKTLQSPSPMHGKTSLIKHSEKGLFKNLPQNIKVARYHSLIIEINKNIDVLELTAWTKDKLPMAIQHKNYPLFGVQFHPESFLTEYGNKIMHNFLKLKFK